ncbi:MAG TPA: flippase, partial [Vicinamibacteria bacterium]
YQGVTWTAVAIFSIDLVLKAVKSTLRFVLKGLERFGAEALSLGFERAALLALGTLSLLSGHGVVALALVFAGVRLFDAAALWIYMHLRVLPVRPSRDTALWAELFRKGLPFAYAGLVITLVFQVDVVLLEKLRGAVEVGYYRPPTLILEGLTLVPRILGYAFIPVIGSLYQSSPSSVSELYRRGCKYLLLAGLPVAAFGILASRQFIPAVFGPDYEPSVEASRILLPAAVLMFLSNFSETTLACIGRWPTIVRASSAALVLNVALNLALIPSFGYVGCAVATLLSEAFYLVATAAAVAAAGHRVLWLRVLPRPLGAALVFSAILWLAGPLGLVAAALVASLSFAAATFALGTWDGKERDAIRTLVSGRRLDPRRLA